jgi:nitroreductase
MAGLKAFGDRSEAASVYPGVQNLLLAARAHGLGATLTTWHLALEPEFKSVLGIPRGVKTFALVPLGWPRGNLGPVKRKPAADVIHRDRW